jgi:hypothetical protein
MDAGDTLHILVKDLVGSAISLSLNNGEDDSEEDTELIGTTTATPTTTIAPLNPTSIYIDTDLISPDFEITISSSTKDVIIDWGDGSADEAVTLIGMGAVSVTHGFLASSEIEIKDADGLEEIISIANIDNLTSIIIPSSCASLFVIDIEDNTGLTSFEIHPEWVLLTDVILSGNAISVDDINDILITLDTMAIPLSTVDLSGGTNAAPTGLGVMAKNNMIGRGITVTTN